MRSFFLMFMIVVLSSGCAHKFTYEKVEKNLGKGKTTKQEVLAAFGEPDSKYTPPGLKLVSKGNEHTLQTPCEVWLYSPHGNKLIEMLNPKMLRVIFDSDGIVSNFNYQRDDD